MIIQLFSASMLTVVYSPNKSCSNTSHPKNAIVLVSETDDSAQQWNTATTEVEHIKLFSAPIYSHLVSLPTASG